VPCPGALEAFPNPYEPFPLTEATLAADGASVAETIAELGLPEDLTDILRGHWTLSFSGSTAQRPSPRPPARCSPPAT
jgi:hypothetical protein